MTPHQWQILSGAIWNLRTWLVARQEARRAGDRITEGNASARIELWRGVCQRLHHLELP